LEITFDPNARREYLTGFSSRKRERRAFGLAMQKVKDRKARLKERKEEREARREREREAEQAQRIQRGEDSSEDEEDEGNERNDEANAAVGKSSGDGAAATSDAAEVVADAARAVRNSEESRAASKTDTFEDVVTRDHFGGSVVVTTTFGVPSDDEDDEDGDRMLRERSHKSKKGIDSEQRYAGSVKKYFDELKGNMPAKKRKDYDQRQFHPTGKKGRHGAATMKGMGTGTDVKMARKALARAEQKGGGGRKRRGKGRGS